MAIYYTKILETIDYIYKLQLTCKTINFVNCGVSINKQCLTRSKL